MYSPYMPAADFYAGLPLAEQLEKFVDHHHDRRVRHISQDEAQIVYEAVARLKAGVSVAERRDEFDANWRRLEHVYETTIVSGGPSNLRLLATSIPARSSPVPDHPEGLDMPMQVVAVSEANARTAQVALNSLLRSYEDEVQLSLFEAWAQETGRRSPPADTRLGEEGNELLNRALYQPTIALEESPPVFVSLTGALAQSEAAQWVALVVDEMGDPVAMLKVGGTLLLLKVLHAGTSGLSKGFEERLYEWARPDQPENDPDDGKKRSVQRRKKGNQRKKRK